MLVSGPMCLVHGTLAGSLEVSVYYVCTFVYDIISQLSNSVHYVSLGLGIDKTLLHVSLV